MKRGWRKDLDDLFLLILDYLNSDDDEREPMLDADMAILETGGDDKAGMPVGRDVPVPAVGRQSTRVMVSGDNQNEAADHDWS